VQLSEGRLLLDPNICFLDVWEVQALFDRIEAFGISGSERSGRAQLEALERELFAQYRGRFLATDSAQAVIPLREQLHGRFLAAVAVLGNERERRGQWRAAAMLYERALAIDETSEALYRSIMTCYDKMGSPSDSLRYYERCRNVMHAVFGIGPSFETNAIYTRILERSGTKSS
jgi:DNA-binding SARP family transcriptional activator